MSHQKQKNKQRIPGLIVFFCILPVRENQLNFYQSQSRIQRTPLLFVENGLISPTQMMQMHLGILFEIVCC